MGVVVHPCFSCNRKSNRCASCKQICTVFGNQQIITIKNIISQNNSPYVFLELEDIDGKNYKIKAAFTHTSVVDVILQSDNYFTDLFGIGNLRTKYPNITEEVWNMISRGKVRKGMTTDECRLALGNPMRIHIVTGGYETWSYERKTLDFTNKKLDRIH